MFYNQKYSEDYEMNYAIHNNEAIILSYTGETPHVEIPDFIENYPVTKIEAYAFSEKSMNYLGLPKYLKRIEHHGFSECRHLTRVSFPAELTWIGNYAFYNCLALKEIHLTALIRSIGFGAFMNCELLSHIIQDRLEGHALSLGSLLDELTHKIHLEMHYLREDGSFDIGKVTFTEYTTDMHSDATAISSTCKQFISGYSGSGRNLRFCIGIDGINYQEYDDMFVKVLHMDDFDTCLEIAMNRLMYPYGLSPKAEDAYMDFLKAHARDTGMAYAGADNPDALKLLCDRNILGAEDMDAAMEAAMNHGHGEIVSLLMDYRHGLSSFADDDFRL